MSFEDYLEARRYDLDVVTQVPHAALRIFVTRDGLATGALPGRLVRGPQAGPAMTRVEANAA
jgi:N-acyl-D-aspartate/D-glutamate deacylase